MAILFGSPEANELLERDKQYWYRVNNAAELIEDLEDELGWFNDEIYRVDKQIKELQKERTELETETTRIKLEIKDLEKLITE